MQKTNSGINRNAIKIIALISMTVDHFGYMLYPDLIIFRAFGRLAMPFFAYMIAEGCRYTSNKPKYLLLVFGLGVICQVVYWYFYQSLLLSILISFSLSIGIIYCIQGLKTRKVLSAILLTLLCALTILVTLVLPKTLAKYSFSLDYGVQGVLMVVLTYLFKSKRQKLVVVGLLCAWLSLVSVVGWVQWFSLLSVPVLALYNQNRGKLKLKYLFYLYYPLHLVAIYLLTFVI